MRAHAHILLVVGVALAACGPAGPGATPRDRPQPGPADVVPDAPGVEACADVPLRSLAQLEAGEGAGERVAVDGVPTPEVICTLLLCGAANPCCNGCGGMYLLADSREHRVSLHGLPGCRGDNCAVTCEPFGSAPTRPYRFVGTHRHQAAGVTSIYAKSEIEVERFCLIAPTPSR